MQIDQQRVHKTKPPSRHSRSGKVQGAVVLKGVTSDGRECYYQKGNGNASPGCHKPVVNRQAPVVQPEPLVALRRPEPLRVIKQPEPLIPVQWPVEPLRAFSSNQLYTRQVPEPLMPLSRAQRSSQSFGGALTQSDSSQIQSRDEKIFKVQIPVVLKHESTPTPTVIHHIKHHHHVVKETKPAPKIPTIVLEHEDEPADEDKVIDHLISKLKPKKREVHVILDGVQQPTRQTDYTVSLGQIQIPHSKQDKHKHYLMHHDDSNVQDGEDIFNEEQNEDKEIMESIKYAEKVLNQKMATPIKLPSDGHSPVRFDTDIDAVQTKAESMTLQDINLVKSPDSLNRGKRPFGSMADDYDIYE